MTSINASRSSVAYSNHPALDSDTPPPELTPQQRAAMRTALIDKPLEDDPVGNAILGGLATAGMGAPANMTLGGLLSKVLVNVAKGVAKALVKETFHATPPEPQRDLPPVPSAPRSIEPAVTPRTTEPIECVPVPFVPSRA